MIKHDEKMHMEVDSGTYLNNKDNFDEMEKEMGMDIDPVDIYGGYVPMDKNSQENLDEVEENIRKRFRL